MINKIQCNAETGKDERITKINQMIEKYNTKQSLLLLQRIDGFAQQLYNIYMTEPNTASSNFMKWYFKNEIIHELRVLSNIPHPTFNKYKLFLDLTILSTPRLPRVEEWQQATTPSIARRWGYSSARNPVYAEVDRYLESAFQPPAADGSYDWKTILHNLEVLQAKLIYILNNNIASDDRKRMKRFSNLLASTNSMMKTVIDMNAELTDRYRSNLDVSIIDPTMSHEGYFIPDFIRHLTLTQDRLQLGEYTLDYLGGNNNKNWKITHRETGVIQLLRIEKPEFFADYLLLNELKTNSLIRPFIAIDSVFYPTEDIEQVEGSGVAIPFNLAISEYCPNGDLLSYRRRQVDKSNGMLAIEALNMIKQVAAFAAELKGHKMAYMDIKPANFLVRSDGSVITADLKSVIRTTDRNVNIQDISTTDEMTPPEYPDSRMYNAEQFMAYQVGISLYLLIIGPTGEEKSALLEEFANTGELDFKHPVFASEAGDAIRTLIRNTTQLNPGNRPTLSEIEHACQRLTSELEHAAAEQIEAPREDDASAGASSYGIGGRA